MDYLLERVIDTVELVGDSLNAAGAPSATVLLGELQQVYVTKSAYTHDQVDQAGKRLLEVFMNELAKVKAGQTPQELSITIDKVALGLPPQNGFRGLSPTNTEGVVLTLATKYPAEANQQGHYRLKSCPSIPTVMIASLFDRRIRAWKSACPISCRTCR